MDKQQLRSLELLKQYFTESSVEERDVLWNKVNQLNIEGPSIEEYFHCLESEHNSFKDSFIGEIVIEPVTGVFIPNAAELTQIVLNNISGNFQEGWSVAGESNFGMAA